MDVDAGCTPQEPTNGEVGGTTDWRADPGACQARLIHTAIVPGGPAVAGPLRAPAAFYERGPSGPAPHTWCEPPHSKVMLLPGG